MINDRQTLDVCLVTAMLNQPSFHESVRELGKAANEIPIECGAFSLIVVDSLNSCVTSKGLIGIEGVISIGRPGALFLRANRLVAQMVEQFHSHRLRSRKSIFTNTFEAGADDMFVKGYSAVCFDKDNEQCETYISFLGGSHVFNEAMVTVFGEILKLEIPKPKKNALLQKCRHIFRDIHLPLFD
jgi:RecA/RadA recombinase